MAAEEVTTGGLASGASGSRRDAWSDGVSVTQRHATRQPLEGETPSSRFPRALGLSRGLGFLHGHTLTSVFTITAIADRPAVASKAGRIFLPTRAVASFPDR